MERHLRLIPLQMGRQYLARASAKIDHETADAFQEGCLGLAQAVLQYETRDDVAFAPFALARIRRAMNEGIVQRRGAIAVPPRVSRRGRREHKAALCRHDPGARPPLNPRPVVLTAYQMNGLPDASPVGRDDAAPTIAQLAHQRYEELAGAIAAEMCQRGSRRRGDRAELIAACLNERWLVEDENCRSPLRALADRFGSSLGRVTHYEACFRERLAVAVRQDSALRQLARFAGGRRAGICRALTPEERLEYEREPRSA